MCGRYTITAPETVERMVENIVGEVVKINARYNVAPQQMNPVVRLDEIAKPRAVTMKWGLVPFWEKDEKPKFFSINARSEGVTETRMFRYAVQERRCLVPADGFYEWHTLPDKTKLPFRIVMKDGGPFFLAGIWEGAVGARPENYALLTTAPNKVMDGIHDRMPVILDDLGAQRWLEQGRRTPEELAALCVPYNADKMRAYPVSKLVSNARNDLKECILPAGEISVEEGPSLL